MTFWLAAMVIATAFHVWLYTESLSYRLDAKIQQQHVRNVMIASRKSLNDSVIAMAQMVVDIAKSQGAIVEGEGAETMKILLTEVIEQGDDSLTDKATMLLYWFESQDGNCPFRVH